jgi:hypothetical protein
VTTDQYNSHSSYLCILRILPSPTTPSSLVPSFQCLVILSLWISLPRESWAAWTHPFPRGSQPCLHLRHFPQAELSLSTRVEVLPRLTPSVHVIMLTSAKWTPPCTFRLGQQPLRDTPRYILSPHPRSIDVAALPVLSSFVTA